MDFFQATFPKGFKFGVATSAYQIEGAWNEDGKGESIWDRHCHELPPIVRNGYTGDVAIDHYHRLDEDLDIIKDLGVNAYRFSIAWTRIIPDGVGKINENGVAFYDRIINGLLSRGIEPMITLFHWDLPAALQEKGGWGNKEIVKWFSKYAETCFKLFGDRVKYWMTMNEVNVFTFRGYGIGVLPPCIRDFKLAVRAAHNALLAHGEAVKIFRKTGLDGKIGIALDIVPKIPATDSAEDKYIADVGNDTESLFFYNAVIKGEYSDLTVKVLKEKNYWPDDIDFSELKTISEKMDFIGVNFYGAQTVKYKKGCGRFDYEVTSSNRENVAYNNFPCEEELFELMMKIKADTDGKLPILITENGTGDDVSKIEGSKILDDERRIDYVRKNLTALIKAIDHGADVIGYTYWSVFDNFEWNWGYDYTLGLVYVDYKNGLKRIKKKSFYWYKNFIKSQRG